MTPYLEDLMLHVEYFDACKDETQAWLIGSAIKELEEISYILRWE